MMNYRLKRFETEEVTYVLSDGNDNFLKRSYDKSTQDLVNNSKS